MEPITNGTSGGTFNPPQPPFTLDTRDLLLPPTVWNIESKRIAGSPTAGNALGATARDWHLTGFCEQGFDAVRLIMLSAEAANNVAGASASIAASANVASPITPTGAWTIFTWTGAGTFTMPTGAAGAFAALASDWMPVQSIARNDSPAVNLPVFMLRIHFPPGPGTYTYTNDTSTSVAFNTPELLNNRRWSRFVQTGIDSVTTPASFTNISEGNTFPSCIVQFRSRGRVASVLYSGDSLIAGSLTTSRMLGAGLLSVLNLSAPDSFALGYVGNGWSGQTTTQSLANAKTLITACQPNIAMWNVYSSNDGGLSQAVADAQFLRAMDFVAYARAAGAIPVLVTPQPLNTENNAASTIKKALASQLQALQYKGVIVADQWGATADLSGVLNPSGGIPWLTGLNGDDIHPNDAGAQAIMVGAIMPALRPILRANNLTL